MFRNFATALLVLGAQVAHGAKEQLKIGLISDLHLHLRYDQRWGPRTDTGEEGDCMVDGGVLAEDLAPMGRYGCDPPSILIETMLEEFIKSHGKQDVIVLAGDFIGHHTAKVFPDPS